MYRLILSRTGTQGELRWRSVSTLIAVWMASGLLVAGACATFTANSPLMGRLVHRAGFVFLFLLLLQLGAAIGINVMIGRFALWQAIALFLAYSMLNGFCLSGLFLAAWHLSLTTAFLILSAAFGLLSIYGVVTRRDLTKLDGMVVMGLVGVALALLIHLLLHSPAPLWIVSFLGVAICVGLLALDARRMKHMDIQADELRASRLAILGALVLYSEFLLGFAKLCAAILRLYVESYERHYAQNGYVPFCFR